MYNVYVSSNYKRTLWFKNRVWNKNIKFSTKNTNLIKAHLNLFNNLFESSETPLVGIKF